MALTKPAGTWNYEALFGLPDDGKRYEIVEGELYEMPSPVSAHAITVINLIASLLPIVAKLGGRLLTAPIDVFFQGANPVQPDILVLLPEGEARIVRRALYGRAGVREYWIVDPEARTIEILALDRDATHSVQTASGDETPDSPLIGPLPIVAEALFAGIDA